MCHRECPHKKKKHYEGIETTCRPQKKKKVKRFYHPKALLNLVVFYSGFLLGCFFAFFVGICSAFSFTDKTNNNKINKSTKVHIYTKYYPYIPYMSVCVACVVCVVCASNLCPPGPTPLPSSWAKFSLPNTLLPKKHQTATRCPNVYLVTYMRSIWLSYFYCILKITWYHHNIFTLDSTNKGNVSHTCKPMVYFPQNWHARPLIDAAHYYDAILLISCVYRMYILHNGEPLMYMRTIEISYSACKHEFRRNPRCHSCF